MMVVLHAPIAPCGEDTSQVRLSHSLARGPVPCSMSESRVARRAGAGDDPCGARRAAGTARGARAAGRRVRVNAPLKVGCLVAGMAAGADSIDDMGLLRHGAMDVLFGGVRAPSTLGSHLRCYAWGMSRRSRRPAAGCSPGSRARRRCFPSPTFWAPSTSTRRKAVYGHQKQGARFGHTKIQAAPRGALSYPRCSREKLGMMFLGLGRYGDLLSRPNWSRSSASFSASTRVAMDSRSAASSRGRLIMTLWPASRWTTSQSPRLAIICSWN
jgi:hypothetical protein